MDEFKTDAEIVAEFIKKYGFSEFMNFVMHLSKSLQDRLLPLAPTAEVALKFSSKFSYKIVYLYEESGAPVFNGKIQATITQRLLDGAIMRPNGEWLRKEDFPKITEADLKKEFPFLSNKKIQVF